MKHRRFLVLVLAVVVLAGMVTSCQASGQGDSQQTTTEVDADDNSSDTDAEADTDIDADVPTVHMLYSLASVPQDQQVVADELNRIALEKAGVNLKLTVLPNATYDTQLNLIIAENSDYDIAFAWNHSGQLVSYVAREALLPLDDLLDEYGQDAKEALGVYIDAGSFNGVSYLLPRINMMATKGGILLVKDLVEKYEIDLSTIKSEADLTPIFEKVSAGEPGMTMVSSEAATSAGWLEFSEYDPLGDNIGVLADPSVLEVVDYPSTDEYAEQCRLHREWALKGFISSDMLTSEETQTDLIRAGRLFGFHVGWKPGVTEEKSNASGGVELVGVPFEGEPISYSARVGSMGFSILEQSDNPEAAMKVLNLLFSDSEFINTIDWGIEGVHYEKSEGNQIQFADGIDAASSAYYHGMDWAFGNSILAHVMKPSSPDLRAELDAYNKSAVISKALGFNFDVSDVKSEFTAVSNVRDKYEQALTSGLLDYDSTIEDYLNELDAAGIEKIITAKQAQLDEWAAKVNS